MQSRPENPFKGLQAYQRNDSGKLFGRDKDVVLIKSRIFSARTTLLFAGSGVGKSSFLNARLIPELEDQFYIVSHNVWSGPETPLDQDKNLRIKAEIDEYQSALQKAKQEQAERRRLGSRRVAVAEADEPDGPGLPRLLSNFAQIPEDFDKTFPSGCLLVLDQFEEIFQYHSYQDYFKTFLYNLSYAINREDLPLRVIISMREEFLGELSIFDNRIPDLFNNYYRLKYPDRDDASDIIRRTSQEVAGVPVDKNNLVQLVRDLSTIEKGTAGFAERGTKDGDGASRFIERDFIVPPYLQISCQRLWQNQFERNQEGADGGGGADGTAVFLSSYKPNEARATLRDFFNEKLGAMSVSEQELASRAFNFLVTKQGAKMAYELTRLAEHMEVDEKKLKETLLKLSSNDTRILRKSPAPDGSLWFELYHDMYGTIVDEWRENFLRRRREQRRRLYIGIGVSALLIFGILFWASRALQKSTAEEVREARARDWQERAEKAEIHEERDQAILFSLQALSLLPPDSDEVKQEMARITGLVGNDYDSLMTTYRLPNDTKTVATALFGADRNSVITQDLDGEISWWDMHTGALKNRGNIWRTGATGGKSEKTEAEPQPGSNGSQRRQQAQPPLHDGDPQERDESYRQEAQTEEAKLVFKPVIRAFVQHNTYRFLVAGIYNNKAEENDKLYIWRGDTGEMLSGSPLQLQARQKRVEGNILIVSFSPDGRYIATEANAKTPILREITETGVRPVENIKSPSYVNHISFSGDSRLLLTACDDHKAYLWDIADGSVKNSFQHDAPVKRAIFSPDGRRVLTRDSKGYIKIWETETGKPVGQTIHTENKLFLTTNLGPDGSTVITKTYPDNRLLFWDGATGNRLDQFASVRGPITDLNLHPDGEYILVINDGAAQLLRIKPVKPDGVLIRFSEDAQGVVLSGDGNMLMMMDEGKVKLWDAGGRMLGEPFDALGLSADGRYFLNRTSPTDVQVVSLSSHQVLAQLPYSDKGPMPGIIVSYDSKYIAAFKEEKLLLWKNDRQNRAPGEPLAISSGTGDINALDFSRDGRLLVYGGEDNQLYGLDLSTDKGISYPELNGVLTAPISDLMLSPDGRLALLGCEDGTVLLFDMESRKLLDKVILGHHIRSVAFSPSGNAALVASDFWVHRFDVTGKALKHITDRLLSDIIWPPFRVLDQNGEKLRVPVYLGPGMLKLEEVDFSKPAAEGPPPRVEETKKLLEEWNQKLKLEFDSGTTGAAW